MPSFASLCADYAYVCRADVATSGGLRGLHTTVAVPKGEPVLAVPWDLTLSTNLSSAPAQHRIATHHLRVAQALLDTIAPEHNTAAASPRDSARRFWREWATLLPSASELPHPATLPPHLLAELQDRTLSAEAASTRAYVEQKTGCASRSACEAAHWAMAMTRSRPFTLPAPGARAPDEAEEHPEEGGGRGLAADSGPACPDAPDVFAFLPLIDMANHESERPNCEVHGVGSKDSGQQRGQQRAYTAVELVALRDLDPDEPISIDYGIASHTMAEQFSDFGFVATHRDPSAHEEPPDRSEFVTSLESDEALMRRYERGAEFPTDPRLPPIVRYRVMRKRTVIRRRTKLAKEHLDSRLSTLGLVLAISLAAIIQFCLMYGCCSR